MIYSHWDLHPGWGHRAIDWATDRIVQNQYTHEAALLLPVLHKHISKTLAARQRNWKQHKKTKRRDDGAIANGAQSI